MLASALDPCFKSLSFLTNDLKQSVREELSQLKDTDCGNRNFKSVAIKEKESLTPPTKKKKTALDILLGLGGDNDSELLKVMQNLKNFCLRNRFLIIPM